MASAEKSSAWLREVRRELIARLAGPRGWKDSRESWLGLAADNSGLGYRTIKSLYYDPDITTDHPAFATLNDAAERYEIEHLAQRFEELARDLRQLVARRGGAAAHRASRS